MTNEEKLNEQIKEVSDMFKDMFTAEELKELEKQFDNKIKEMNNEKGVGDN